VRCAALVHSSTRTHTYVRICIGSDAHGGADVNAYAHAQVCTVSEEPILNEIQQLTFDVAEVQSVLMCLNMWVVGTNNARARTHTRACEYAAGTEGVECMHCVCTIICACASRGCKHMACV